MVNKWLKIVQQWLQYCLPCTCLFCLAPSQREIALCQACEKFLPWLGPACPLCAVSLKEEVTCLKCQYLPPPFEHLQALFDYQWPVSRFISRFKYQGELAFGKLLGKLMAEHLIPKTPVECIVPVPLHIIRQQERGFNQALELAKIIAKNLQLPLDKASCKKKWRTPPQSGLGARKRQSNLTYQAFEIAPSFKKKHILIIDDVVTTGATLSAFTLALKKAGALTVEAWVCGRTGMMRT